MSDIEKNFVQLSYQRLEFERLSTEELGTRFYDIFGGIEKHFEEEANISVEWIRAYYCRCFWDISPLTASALADSERKLELLLTMKDELDEQAAYIERLEATIKAHGLDVDR